jgi:DNA-binding LacI/PurR family transcriptional regulator
MTPDDDRQLTARDPEPAGATATPANAAPAAAADSATPGRRGGRRKPTEPVRMRDIARVAGVSQSTVSRVLNNADTVVPIAAATRARVMDAARKLDYRPNPFARALRGAPTMLLGVIVRDFGDPFFAAAIDTLATVAHDNGYNIVLGHAHGRLDEATPLTAILETRHTDAIILLGDIHDQPRIVEDLRSSQVPVVATWQGISPVDFPTADIDDAIGMRLGLDHLLGLGHERIAVVSARLPLDNPFREGLYVELMRERFGSVTADYIQRVPNSLAGGEAALAALLALPEPPTAVLATTDLVAVGVLHRAWSLGCAVPADLSVVGYDDLYIAAHTVPPLTTIRMPTLEIIREAVRLAIELPRDPEAWREPGVTRFAPTLVVRQSTTPPRR